MPRASIRGSKAGRAARSGPFAGPTGSVIVKELRTWWRDPLRVQNIVVAVPWALGTVLLPLTFDTDLLLPWAGPALALAAAVCCVNLYGQDGTALWLTLLVPQAERHDLRGRQWAFLLVFAPITVVGGLICALSADIDWTWPWILGLTPAYLFGGVGLLALLAVVAVIPGPDAHHRPDNPMEQADATGPANLMFWTGILLGAPAGAVALAGTLLGNALLSWAAVPVGLFSGILLGWWLGSIAYRRLEARGPELLLLMRVGRVTSSAKGSSKTAQPLPKWQQAVLGLGWPVGAILLFPRASSRRSSNLATAGCVRGSSRCTCPSRCSCRSARS